MKFVDFCEREIELQNIAESSRRQQKVTINKLRAFDAKASFADITVEFLPVLCSVLEKGKEPQPE